MNLLSSGVINGLVSASSYKDYADTAIGVYQSAKRKGDKETMKRAMGYAQDSINSAIDNTKKAQIALEKAQKEAREQAKIDRQEALDKQDKKVEQQSDKQEKNTNIDTVEISEKCQGSNIKQGDEIVVDDIVDNKEVNIETYTAKGKVNSPLVQKLLTTA